MIGSLSGTLAEVCGETDSAVDLVLDVSGVGYRVSVAPRTAVTLPPIGSELHLAVHTHVRESAITLYGFASSDERRCFELLIGAHGIGPALALSILAVHPPDVLAKVVADEDLDSLMLVPGVGRKTAQRLLVELQSRLDGFQAGSSPRPASAGSSSRTVQADVGEALAALGYGTDEVRGALAALDGIETPEDLLRSALQHLGRRR
ncbi:MAG TPA: Holliday junction branch migration protein RuvA [Acidimicrobiales bacterium]|nr:Holliday junction branch migration protein RuvA [Acidimicrobiales bacterium]